MGYLRAASSALGIGLIADMVQLLPRPGRPGYQAKGELAPDDRRRYIANGSRLAYRGDLVGLAHHAYPSGLSPLPAS